MSLKLPLKTPTPPKIILGIDPGTRKTGYGVIRCDRSGIVPLDFGVIRPSEKEPLSVKILSLYEGVLKIVEVWEPDALSVETQYVAKNAQSALKLGMARSAAMLGGKKLGLPIFEYPPSRAKLAVVGLGSASKSQVQSMIQKRFKLSKLPPEDAADALALAICHAHNYRFGKEV